MKSLSDAILRCAVSRSLPKGGEGRIIGVSQIADLAVAYSVPGHDVEAEALRLDVYPTRYLRNMDSISASQQFKLLKSTVAQVGLGGLGGNLLDMFLRVGIGTINATDGDHFEESNLNRQALSTPDLIDVPKAEAAKLHAERINPSVTLTARNEFLDATTLPGFIDGADIVIDALGGLETRPALQKAASDADIPLVTGALAGWTGYIGLVMPSQPGPADIMGTNNGAEEKLGCPSPAVAFFASLMATEAVRMLSGYDSQLASSMLIVDLQSLTFERISL